jgi:tRNA pseudouridine55 synthase
MTAMTDQLNGILLVAKPAGPTSHDVVARLRRLSGQRRIGHTGTLDPLAEGLLVLCLGRATRVAQFLVGLDKTYLGTIELGGISSTYDAEGAMTPQHRPLPADADAVARAMATQLGEQIQLPPPYSAVKVGGRKLYDYARAGEVVPEKPRTVHVHRFDLLHYDPPHAHFEAKVGSGTYLRSMAHNLGLALGCGAFLRRLRRTRIGAFALEDAFALETLEAEPDLLPGRLLGIAEALGHLPKVTIRPEAARLMLNGRPFTTGDVLECDGILHPGRPVLVLDASGRALSVVRPVPQPTAEAAPPTGEMILGTTPMLFKPMRILAGA